MDTLKYSPSRSEKQDENSENALVLERRPEKSNRKYAERESRKSRLTSGYGEPSAIESRIESNSSPRTSPSVKSSALSDSGPDELSVEGSSRVAAGRDAGGPLASVSVGEKRGASFTATQAELGAVMHWRLTELSERGVMRPRLGGSMNTDRNQGRGARLMPEEMPPTFTNRISCLSRHGSPSGRIRDFYPNPLLEAMLTESNTPSICCMMSGSLSLKS